MHVQTPQRPSPCYCDPTSTTITVPSYPDSIIYMHALKVANHLEWLSVPSIREKEEKIARPGLWQTQALFLRRCIGVWPFSRQRASPDCAQVQCMKLSVGCDPTHVFVPEKGKGQPITRSAHIGFQANSYPLPGKCTTQRDTSRWSWKRKTDNLQVLGTTSIIKGCSDYFASFLPKISLWTLICLSFSIAVLSSDKSLHY